MKFSNILIVAALLFTAAIGTAQEKQITLEEIWEGEFTQDRLQSLQSLKNGNQYVVLNRNSEENAVSIDVYNYKNGQKTGSLVTTANLDELETFQGFKLSEDEDKILLSLDVEPIYRHSTKAVYYIYDIKSESLTKLTDRKVQEPTFSPDGSKVAYVFENDIYIYEVSTGEETRVTTDGKKNEIINGITDWVYEEEFAFVRGFEWNKDGDKIAFLKFDETEVPEISMDIYGEELYPDQLVFKYPKAGEPNSEVSLHLYDLAAAGTEKVNLGDYKDFYIPRIKWTQDAEVLSVQVLNRHQNNLDLIFVDAQENTAKVVMNERDKAYVDVTDNLTFLKDNSYFWTSEADGYNHFYHYDEDGQLINQVTSGEWEVTSYYGFDRKKEKIFYQSTENGSVNRDVYSIDIHGKNKERLTERTGMNSADFSADFTYFINAFTNTETPLVYTLHRAKNGKMVREIMDNSELLKKEEAYNFSPKELSTIHINGNDLNMWMIKPKDFDENKAYPLLMFQYSGPGSQSVTNSYFSGNDYWYQLLANEGYIIACVDGRGTGYKGADFKKITQKELGKYELEDQIDAAKGFGSRSYIDKESIGIWGWSFGGYMSSNAILKANDVFSMAIAVAPVISWRFYDTIYTERYMTTPQENPSGYDENSPINHVEKLKGDYLLVHGTGDDNVHVQNTMRMIDALVQANKQFDWALYPDRNHAISGGNTRLHLYTKMTDFIKEKLKNRNKNSITTTL